MTPNEIMHPSATQTPEVGMGCTILYASDRRPGTISRVSASGKSFWYRDDEYTRTDNNGMSESQTYTFTENPHNPEVMVRRLHTGRWRSSAGNYIAIGYRSAYYDFSY